MKQQLQYLYRNEKGSLEMIDFYLNQFVAYTEEEQNYLKSNQDALCVDFESFVNRFDEDA